MGEDLAYIERKFDEPHLTTEQQIELLINRGLNVTDHQQAQNNLNFIGSYRLSAYALSFQNGGYGLDKHHFKSGTTFDQILDLYLFDRKLRLLVMDAIEKIEVAIRAVISSIASAKYSPHWFLNSERFESEDEYKSFLKKLKQGIANHRRPNSQESFVKGYYEKYTEPELPPSEMVMEMLMFGTLSRLYSNLKIDLNKDIAALFGIHRDILKSWLHSLSCLRNLCAHHALLWNRKFTIKPKILNKVKNDIHNNDDFFAQTFVLVRMLRKISQDTQWEDRLEALFQEYPGIDPKVMGFPPNWGSLPIWG